VIVKNTFGDIQQITLADGVQALLINHQACQAELSLYGGQVLTWQPSQHKPVLWLSDKAIYRQGKAIRGGIPICWPWFGGFSASGSAQEVKAGNHGFARQSIWQLDRVDIQELGVYLTLTLSGKNKHPLWPHAFKLTQEIFFGTELKQSLHIQNNSNVVVNYSGALHTYFRVSSPKNIAIPALVGMKFDDKLTAKPQNTAANTPEKVQCVGAVDRVYHSSKAMQIIDQQWQRVINIQTTNTQQWVLWNPGKAGAEAMADIHDKGENEYICLEAANTQRQSIAASSTVTLGQTIAVNSLDRG